MGQFVRTLEGASVMTANSSFSYSVWLSPPLVTGMMYGGGATRQRQKELGVFLHSYLQMLLFS